MKTKIISLTRQEKNSIKKINYSTFKTKFGKFLIASVDQGICTVLLFKKLSESLQKLHRYWANATLVSKEMPIHILVKKNLSSKKVNTTIPLVLYGTKFQLSVWSALLTIPLGQTSTYTKIATQIGRPKAVRAVGTAIGGNPICYLIPCHRVLSSNGDIGGYRWGTKIKKSILSSEKVKLK